MVVTYTHLQAVIKETLRLFPALGVNLPRLVPKGGLTLAGRTFPEGVRYIYPLSPFAIYTTKINTQTVVGVNAWVAHANISVFGPDAAIFRPERWLESPEKCRIMEQYSMTVIPLIPSRSSTNHLGNSSAKVHAPA